MINLKNYQLNDLVFLACNAKDKDVAKLAWEIVKRNKSLILQQLFQICENGKTLTIATEAWEICNVRLKKLEPLNNHYLEKLEVLSTFGKYHQIIQDAQNILIKSDNVSVKQLRYLVCSGQNSEIKNESWKLIKRKHYNDLRTYRYIVKNVPDVGIEKEAWDFLSINNNLTTDFLIEISRFGKNKYSQYEAWILLKNQQLLDIDHIRFHAVYAHNQVLKNEAQALLNEPYYQSLCLLCD